MPIIRMLSRAVVASLAAALSFTPIVRAQSLGAVAVEPPDQREPYRIDAAYAHRFETDVDNNGKFSEENVFARFASRTKLSSTIDWHNVFMYGFSAYDFSNTDRGGWWGDVHSLTYVPTLSWQVNKRWSVFGGPVLQVAAESGGDFGDGVSGGAVGAFSWSPDPSLRVGAGLVALSRLESDATLAPIPIVHWQFAENWRLRSGLQNFAARQGFGGEIGWAPSDSIELSAGIAFQRLRFRMDDDGPTCLPGDPQCSRTQSGQPTGNVGSPIKDGVGDDRSVPVFGRLTFTLSDGMEVEASAGAALAGEMRLEDKKGRKIAKGDYDPQAVIGLRLIRAF